MVLDKICNKDYNMGRANEKASKDFIVSILYISKLCTRPKSKKWNEPLLRRYA